MGGGHAAVARIGAGKCFASGWPDGCIRRRRRDLSSRRSVHWWSVATFGWRGMFLIGILPALLTIYLRFASASRAGRARRKQAFSIRPLFTGEQAIVTWGAALMLAAIILGLWSSNFWAPTVVVDQAHGVGQHAGPVAADGALASLISNVGTFAGCFLMPWIIGWFGSRKTAGILFFVGALVCNVVAYYGLLVRLDNIKLFLIAMPVLGFFTNGVFALFTIWLPELFASQSRGAGIGFAFSLGRILAAAGP